MKQQEERSPILMSPSPLGSPAATGKVEEMRKYQKHNWIKYNLIKSRLMFSMERGKEISQNVSKMYLEEFLKCICFKEMSFCRCKKEEDQSQATMAPATLTGFLFSFTSFLVFKDKFREIPDL